MRLLGALSCADEAKVYSGSEVKRSPRGNRGGLPSRSFEGRIDPRRGSAAAHRGELPRRGGDLLEVDSGLVAHTVQEVEEVLRPDVPGRAGSVRAAPQPPGRGVEDADPLAERLGH